MKKFNDGLECIEEDYGLRETKTHFPRKLKLSEEFVKSFLREFNNQIQPIVGEGNKDVKSRSKHQVIKEFQRALPFLIN